MADRMMRAVSDGPRRRIGFGTALALVTALVAVFASGAFASSPSARTTRAAASATTKSGAEQSGTQGSQSTQDTSGTQQSTPQLSPQQINSKVSSLLSKMTVDEKFGQLEQAAPDGPNGTPGDLISEAQNGQIGSVLDLIGVRAINQVQRAALKSRLHIPLIFGLDVIHGYKTMFPVPLAEASSWDPSLVQNDESVSASEATADGIKWTFNPMVDISRDARWGRVVEGAGEDPFLGSAIAAAKVKGYQGNNFAAPDKMAADDQALRRLWGPGRRARIQHVDMSTSSCSTTICRPIRRRSTPARRR